MSDLSRLGGKLVFLCKFFAVLYILLMFLNDLIKFAEIIATVYLINDK